MIFDKEKQGKKNNEERQDSDPRAASYIDEADAPVSRRLQPTERFLAGLTKAFFTMNRGSGGTYIFR